MPWPKLIGNSTNAYLSQGCLPASLYTRAIRVRADYGAFGVPNAFMLPYVLAGYSPALSGPRRSLCRHDAIDESARSSKQQINPRYDAKNDTLELNADYNVTPALTFTSQTGYNTISCGPRRITTASTRQPGIFLSGFTPVTNRRTPRGAQPDPNGGPLCVPRRHDQSSDSWHQCVPDARQWRKHIPRRRHFCDPQFGCSDRLVVQDLSDEHAWQLSQEFRLASNFKGPFNFSVGGNYHAL